MLYIFSQGHKKCDKYGEPKSDTVLEVSLFSNRFYRYYAIANMQTYIVYLNLLL